jgi:CRP-like cAMP-binding protein
VLAGANLINHTSPAPLHRVVVDLTVAYSNAPTLAKAMLLDAATGTPGVVSNPPPHVLATTIDDPLMGYQVHLWVDDYRIVPQVKSDFGSLVWYQSHRHGVPLPSPAQDLYLHDAEAMAQAALPKPAVLRTGLQTSPLLASIADGDMDLLVGAARPARYATAEVIADSRSTDRDLIIMVEGRADLVYVEAGFDDAVIGSLDPGDSIAPLDAPRTDGHLQVRAVGDCEVVIVESTATGDVASRNAELAGALNRSMTLRRRRVERIAARRATAPAPPTTDPADPADPTTTAAPTTTPTAPTDPSDPDTGAVDPT